MKKDPVTTIRVLIIILGISLVILPIINVLEKGKSTEGYSGVMFLFCSMFFVYGAIKQMAKRIDELEKKVQTSKTDT